MEFDALRSALQALAAPAGVQLARFPDFTMKADELALDFADALALVRHNRAREIGPDQAAALEAVDGHLDRTSSPASAHLWTEGAVRAAPEWAEVRRLAGAALQAFAWPVEPPPPSGTAYVGAGRRPAIIPRSRPPQGPELPGRAGGKAPGCAG
jgi:hypothetical protein